MRRIARIGAHEHAVFGRRVPDSGCLARTMRENTPPELRDLGGCDGMARWAEGIDATLADGRATNPAGPSE